MKPIFRPCFYRIEREIIYPSKNHMREDKSHRSEYIQYFFKILLSEKIIPQSEENTWRNKYHSLIFGKNSGVEQYTYENEVNIILFFDIPHEKHK